MKKMLELAKEFGPWFIRFPKESVERLSELPFVQERIKNIIGEICFDPEGEVLLAAQQEVAERVLQGQISVESIEKAVEIAVSRILRGDFHKEDWISHITVQKVLEALKKMGFSDEEAEEVVAYWFDEERKAFLISDKLTGAAEYNSGEADNKPQIEHRDSKENVLEILKYASSEEKKKCLIALLGECGLPHSEIVRIASCSNEEADAFSHCLFNL